LSTAALILATDAPRLEQIVAPEVSFPIFVRVWTPQERREFRAYWATREENVPDFAYLAWLSACDEQGVRIFAAEHLEQLRAAQGTVGLLCERIGVKALVVNDLAKPIDDAKKNSGPTPKDSSSTS